MRMFFRDDRKIQSKIGNACQNGTAGKVDI